MGSKSKQATDQSTKITEETNITIGDLGFSGDAGVAFANVLGAASVAQTFAVAELVKPVSDVLIANQKANTDLFNSLAGTVYNDRINDTLTTGLSFKAVADQSKKLDEIDKGGFDPDFLLPIALAAAGAFIIVKGIAK